MTKFSFWQRWLLVVGLVVAFLNGSAAFEVFAVKIDSIIWIDGGMSQAALWAYGAWGATVAGWGIFIAFIAHYPFRRRERWSWNCLAAGLLVWYVVDTAISLHLKGYDRAIINTVLLILITLPLACTRKHFS